jgi:hypothetical protein
MIYRKAPRAAPATRWGRLGELLKGTAKAKGALRRGSRQEPRDTTPALADLGISKKLSHVAQLVAEVPPAERSVPPRIAAHWQDRGTMRLG